LFLGLLFANWNVPLTSSLVELAAAEGALNVRKRLGPRLRAKIAIATTLPVFSEALNLPRAIDGGLFLQEGERLGSVVRAEGIAVMSTYIYPLRWLVQV